MLHAAMYTLFWHNHIRAVAERKDSRATCWLHYVQPSQTLVAAQTWLTCTVALEPDATWKHTQCSQHCMFKHAVAGTHAEHENYSLNEVATSAN